MSLEYILSRIAMGFLFILVIIVLPVAIPLFLIGWLGLWLGDRVFGGKGGQT